MSHRATASVPAILLAMLAALGPGNASACSCAPYPEDVDQATAMAHAHSDAVFLGEALSTKSEHFPPPPTRVTTFSVRKAWKGGYEETTVVLSAMGEIACGFRFRRSETYLVFANWDPRRQALATNLCSLTRRESSAGAHIAALDRLSGR